MAQCYAKCTNCGAVLQVESTMEAAVCPQCSVAFSMEKAIQNYYGSAGNPAEQSKKRRKKFNVWAVVEIALAVVLVTIGGILLYQTLSNNNNGGDTTINNNEGDNNTVNNNEGDNNVVNNEGDNNTINNNNNNSIVNNNKEQNGNASKVDPDALKGRYISESGLYEIVFREDFTCVWYQESYGHELYFDGTYEKERDNYVLHMEGGNYSYNTRFVAEPVEGGFIITGGVVYGEFFEKQ